MITDEKPALKKRIEKPRSRVVKTVIVRGSDIGWARIKQVSPTAQWAGKTSRDGVIETADTPEECADQLAGVGA